MALNLFTINRLPVCINFSQALSSLKKARSAENASQELRYFLQPEGVAGSSIPYGANTTVGNFAVSADASIYYETYGKGEPLVVLHGGAVGSAYELGTLIDRLRETFTVIVVSTRGHGRSEIGTEPLSIEQKVRDVLAVIDAAAGKRPVRILGFSDGAYTALMLASLHPERVERIAAIGAGTLKPGFFTAGTLRVSDIEKADKAFVDQQRGLMPEPDRLQEFWTAYMDFWSKTEVGKELLSAIRCPVLLIAGDEDDHAPAATVLQAHAWIPNSRLCIVPKAWHAAFLDNFAVTWAAIEPFMSAKASALEPSRKVPMNSEFTLTS